MKELKQIQVSEYDLIPLEEMKNIFGGSGEGSGAQVCKNPGAKCGNMISDSGTGNLIGITLGTCTTVTEMGEGESGTNVKKFSCQCIGGTQAIGTAMLNETTSGDTAVSSCISL